MIAVARIGSQFSLKAFVVGTLAFGLAAIVAAATFFRFFLGVLLVSSWVFAVPLRVFGLALDLMDNAATSNRLLPARLVYLSAALGVLWLPFLVLAASTLTRLAGGSV